jgi:hypothetical protein
MDRFRLQHTVETYESPGKTRALHFMVRKEWSYVADRRNALVFLSVGAAQMANWCNQPEHMDDFDIWGKMSWGICGVVVESQRT